MKQTLIVFVQDEPGVLNRVSSHIRRKNFNIESNVIFAVSKNKTDTVLNAFKKDHTIKIKKLKKQNEIT